LFALAFGSTSVTLCGFPTLCSLPTLSTLCGFSTLSTLCGFSTLSTLSGFPALSTLSGFPTLCGLSTLLAISIRDTVALSTWENGIGSLNGLSSLVVRLGVAETASTVTLLRNDSTGALAGFEATA
jgi:hypothetical protein